jgi:5'/3'-nucleotidase SurE
MRYPALLAVIVSSLVLGWTPDAYAAEREPLRILLTNDDGYDAPGIRAMHERLVAAGHDVTLVAPLNDQSGSGIRVTTQGKLYYEDHAPAVWSVDGTPADAVLVGLQHILADDPPDLVVSGANFGPNLGYAGSSGTVGAARMATLCRTILFPEHV